MSMMSTVSKSLARATQRPPETHTYGVRVLERPEQWQDALGMWEDLVKRAAEANPFYEPWMLLPAIRHAAQSARIVFVTETDENARKTRAIGMLPLRVRRSFHRLPLKSLATWRHEHCYVCTPLVAAGAHEAFWSTFMGWARQQNAAAIELNDVHLGGAVMCDFLDWMQQQDRPCSIDSVFTRPIVQFNGDIEAYIRSGGSSPKSAERGRRRLQNSGRLEIRQLEPADALEPWLDAFLELEARGWKGRGGTALACRERDVRYFRETSAGAFERGRLMMLEVRHDAKLIAAQVNVRAGDGVFGLKAAYDEEYRRDSPGMMLVVEAMRRLYADPGVRWIDSCAAPHNNTLKRMWHERRLIANIICPIGHRGGNLAMSMLPVARYLKRHTPHWRHGSKPAAHCEGGSAGT